jgi:alcohol dehydrogenase class IV
LSEQLKKEGVGFLRYSIPEEPTTDLALAAVDAARRGDCDFVIGIGGGSVLDTGKIVAALLTNKGELMKYLEVVGDSQPLKNRSAPYIAIPTTAGTGTEVTRNAVLNSPKHHVKVSMRSPLMLPQLALIDPELTYSMPPAITASTGLDAFTQLLEAFVSRHSNPVTDAVCREGIQRAARSITIAYQDGEDATAREDMCIASLFGGLALANAKLGAVHGLAGPLGGMYKAAHGALCAGLLPYVMDTNFKALKTRAPESKALDRYDEVAHLITGSSKACATEGISWMHSLCKQLNIPPLAEYGITEAEFSLVANKAQQSSSMKGNPIDLTTEEIVEILQRAI